MSAAPARVLIIEPDGAMSLRTITPDLPTLQALVDGPIEAVTMFGTQPWVAYCDEEGKLSGKSLNIAATRLARTLGWRADDVLVGPVVFLGLDDEGAEIDVPGHVLAVADAFGSIERG